MRGEPVHPLLIVYADYECPHCAAAWLDLRERALRIAFRHFPVRSAHPRATPAAHAAEAAGLQDAFWPMHEALFADQSHLDDPHLWERAGALGLDLERFEADRRSEAVSVRVRRDFTDGIRAGVITTPALFDATGARVQLEDLGSH